MFSVCCGQPWAVCVCVFDLLSIGFLGVAQTGGEPLFCFGVLSEHTQPVLLDKSISAGD